MNQYNSPNVSLKKDDSNQWSVDETVGNINNVSKNIREYSLKMREIMKGIRESGVIPEIALAVREGSFAVRDTAKDVNETVHELKNNEVLVDTIDAVENTLKSGFIGNLHETVQYASNNYKTITS